VEDPVASMPVRHAPPSPARRAWRRFTANRLGLIGLAVLATLVLLAAFAPAVARSAPDAIDLNAMSQGPSWLHLLGTDQTGRDVFARVIYGGRVDLTVGLMAALISVVLGGGLGAIAGYGGPGWDAAIMRFTDLVMTFPAIVIVLSVAAIAGPGEWNTILVIGLLNWPVPCRLVRSKVLLLREQEFVLSAQAQGQRPISILLAHVLPNTVDVLAVNTTLGVANAILLAAGLAFLGLGVQPPTPSWGNMVEAARNINVMERLPWEWIPAGVAIVLTVLSINFVGDALRDALDPRSAGRVG
jgi:peptide/nickel transport system permease protein